jgi:hypothetical protein
MILPISPAELLATFFAGVLIGSLIHEATVHPFLAKRARIWRRLR